MKTILISTSILLTGILGATELSWVDEQIEAIKPPRKSLTISKIRNPFIFLEKNGFIKKEPIMVTEQKTVSTTNKKGIVVRKTVQVLKKKTTPFILDAILNTSVLINGQWYKKNEKIRAYTIVKIDKSSVLLKSGDKKIVLSTNIKKQTLKFKNK